MANEISSVCVQWWGQARALSMKEQQTLSFSMLKCVSGERNFFLKMNASFDLNHSKLAAASRFATIASKLSTQSPIDSQERVQSLLSPSMPALEGALQQIGPLEQPRFFLNFWTASRGMAKGSSTLLGEASHRSP